ncbi:MAG: alpha/beta fold hydrolase [Anaerolineae bacterium]|jgi:predicted peptidase|nr:alpha/beta fold hydrolase [Anaerolineae bacterium]
MQQMYPAPPLAYWLHLPPTGDQQTLHPFIVFLHGRGESGDNPEWVKKHGLPKFLDDRPEFPFVVLSPQCPANSHWGEQTDAVIALCDHICATYPVDPARQYLTGFSMGGAGAWLIASRHPARFAAMASVCAYTPSETEFEAELCGMKDLPVWIFHGEQDTIIPVSHAYQLETLFSECGGDASLTIHPDQGHSAKVYADAALYDWLLQHTNEET